jgi:hypothetical protein
MLTGIPMTCSTHARRAGAGLTHVLMLCLDPLDLRVGFFSS